MCCNATFHNVALVTALNSLIALGSVSDVHEARQTKNVQVAEQAKIVINSRVTQIAGSASILLRQSQKYDSPDLTTGLSQAAVAPSQSDARWSILRSVPSLSAGSTVVFEIDLTNYPLVAPANLQIAVNSLSTARDSDFVQGLQASIAAATNADVSYDPRSGVLSFGPRARFPFSFTMTTRQIDTNADFILDIRNASIGQIDVAQAGVRLGALTLPPHQPMLGLNESSGEFGVGKYPFMYLYPGKDRIAWAGAEGFGMLRVPFRARNIQPSSNARIDEDAMRLLDSVLDACAANRIICLLDLHDFGDYALDDASAGQGLPGVIGVSNLRIADFWAQIADRCKNNPYVWFDLMNEPNRQSALAWVKTSNAIAAAIRATGAKNTIVFQGSAWDGAWTWQSSGNAEQILKAYDPGNNFVFEAHQYLDADGGGTSHVCVKGSGAARLEPFTRWLQKYGLQGIIGEVGWAANSECTVEATALLTAWRKAFISTTAGGYVGLIYWAAGPSWPNDYLFLAEPRPFPSGREPLQLRTLKSFSPQ